jgi:hypothetical protein
MGNESGASSGGSASGPDRRGFTLREYPRRSTGCSIETGCTQAIASDLPLRPTEPHERWQADFKVKMDSASLELTDVFNIRDDASLVKTCVIDC